MGSNALWAITWIEMGLQNKCFQGFVRIHRWFVLKFLNCFHISCKPNYAILNSIGTFSYNCHSVLQFEIFCLTYQNNILMSNKPLLSDHNSSKHSCRLVTLSVHVYLCFELTQCGMAFKSVHTELVRDSFFLISP